MAGPDPKAYTGFCLVSEVKIQKKNQFTRSIMLRLANSCLNKTFHSFLKLSVGLAIVK